MHKGVQSIVKRHKRLIDGEVMYDEDGFTIWLKKGWINRNNEAHIITHSWDMDMVELRSEFKAVEKCNCKDCASKA